MGNDLPVKPSNSAFKTTLEEARKRLQRETELRDDSIRATERHEAEIVNLRRVITSLAAMLGEPNELESIGITEAVRTVMMNAHVPLRLRNVRDQLSDVGFDARTQSNLDASVQAVLNRLVDRKEISKHSVTLADGKTTVLIYAGPKVTKTQLSQTAKEIHSRGK